MDKVTTLGSGSGSGSRVGARGDVISFDKAGKPSVSAFVEVLDDSAAAVWQVRDIKTGRMFRVLASTIRFYN